MLATYAVLFKVHFWDDFSRRQLDRLKAAVERGDVYVVMDETMKLAPEVPGEAVIRISSADLADLGLAPFTTHGSVLWYNSDYPNYVALAKIPAYDYYVTVEYDAVLYDSVDRIVDRMANERVDYLGFELRTPTEAWPWVDMHLPMYGADMLKFMSSVAFFSHRALQRLLARRQAQGIEFATGKLPCWPMLEVFVPHEMRAAGMRIAALQEYTGTTHFDWWPPTEENALPEHEEQAFYHPVLHGTRFVRSVLHHEPSVRQLLLPGSRARQKVAHFDAKLVRRIVSEELLRRVSDRLHRELARLGLRPQWYADVVQGTHQSRQRPSAHNAA